MLWRKVQPCEPSAIVTLFPRPARLQSIALASISRTVTCLTFDCARSPGQIQLQPRKHFRVRTCPRARQANSRCVPLIIMLPSAHVRPAFVDMTVNRRSPAECRRSPQKFTPSVTHVVLVRAQSVRSSVVCGGTMMIPMMKFPQTSGSRPVIMS